MSKLTERLRKIKIHNEWGMVSLGNPFIYYVSPDPRSCLVPSWHLLIKGKEFKTAPWYDRGALTFPGYGGVEYRRKALERALAKCKQLFPEIEMVKGPWRMTYVPKEDLKKALDRLKEMEEKE